MLITKQNKKRRKGFSTAQIVIGIALMAGLSAMIAPRFMTADLTAYKVNIKQEVEVLQNIVENYANAHDGKTKDLTWKKVLDDKMLNNSFNEAIHIDGSTADFTKDYYTPRWGKGDIKIYFTGNSDGITANVYITMSANNALKTKYFGPLETAIYEAASKFGNNAVDGSATAISKSENTTGAAADTDGKILFSIR